MLTLEVLQNLDQKPKPDQQWRGHQGGSIVRELGWKKGQTAGRAGQVTGWRKEEALAAQVNRGLPARLEFLQEHPLTPPQQAMATWSPFQV